MVNKRSKREALLAMDTLSELWLLTLLPDRKMIPFARRPLAQLEEGKPADRNAKLVAWHYEAELKARFAVFVSTLESYTSNNPEQIKNKALGVIYELIAAKPEQEQKLLAVICNKLGDPEKKTAAKARHLLQRLTDAHPNMKGVIVQEIQHVLVRSHLTPRAQYAVFCFLNQLELSNSESNKALARKLIEIYFQYFQSAVGEGEVQSKMLSALLTGVNRAYPFADLDEGMFSKQIDTLFKMVQVASFACSIQALTLLLQIMDSRSAVSDRFYKALYAKLLDPELTRSSKQAMFLNLVFRSMKADPIVNRVKAFVKRLLQICSIMPPPFVCGVLMLISKIIEEKPAVQALINLPEEDDDDEEDFKDAKDSDDEGEGGDEGGEGEGEGEGGGEGTPAAKRLRYAMKKKDPLQCGAETSCLWELDHLARHYHPSVEMFCAQLASGLSINYPGDPLHDFTSARFLERFVFKKPKAKKSDRGGSLMQPKAAGSEGDVMVNTEEFLLQEESKVPVEERFFYKYFTKKAAAKKAEEADADADAADDDDGGIALPDGPADIDDDLDFSGAFGLDAGNSDDDEDGLAAAMLEDEGEFGDLSDGEEEEMDLEAIAREGFGEDGNDDFDPEATSVFQSAEDFSHLMEENAEDTSEKKEMKRDLAGGSEKANDRRYKKRPGRRHQKGKGGGGGKGKGKK